MPVNTAGFGGAECPQVDVFSQTLNLSIRSHLNLTLRGCIPRDLFATKMWVLDLCLASRVVVGEIWTDLITDDVG